MVRGLDKFKEYFQEYTDQYVFIGGTACDIVLEHEKRSFRQTKDLDVVLIVEALNEEFVNRFIHFIKLGGYVHINKGTGNHQFYRFEKPSDPQFPYMIELFSRQPDYLNPLDTRLTPIHISDDVISLSAILLDEDYYSLIQRGTILLDGLSVLDLEYLILFKIKAWLDLIQRKASGEQIDSKHIRKHKNDILRLAVSIAPGTKISVSERIACDIRSFLEKNESQPADLNSLGLKGVTLADIFSIIKTSYEI